MEDGRIVQGVEECHLAACLPGVGKRLLQKPPLGLAGDARRAVENLGLFAYHLADGASEEGVVGAAQHHRVHRRVKVGREVGAEVVLHLLALEDAPLHKFHEAGAGDGIHAGFRLELLLEVVELLLVEGHLRGHDQNMAAGVALHGGLQGRFRADDGHSGVALPQEGSRGGGGRVAGDDDGLGAPGKQELRRLQAQRLYLLEGLVPIGGVAGIAEVEVVLPGQSRPQCPQDADASQAGIKNPHRGGACHGRLPPFCVDWLSLYRFGCFWARKFNAIFANSLLEFRGGRDKIKPS